MLNTQEALVNTFIFSPPSIFHVFYWICK